LATLEFPQQLKSSQLHKRELKIILFLLTMISFMKPITFVALIITIFFPIACSSRNSSESASESAQQDAAVVKEAVSNDNFPTGKVIARALCKSDSTQSYALYTKL
jgi:zona occludens toxin (predicted ATPase)